jgi:ribosomal protein S18 acetylase RimI-like enzyme
MEAHDDRAAAPGGGGGPVLRPATAGDGPAVGALHAEQIPGGFLAVLGPDFLARLYRRITRTSGSFLLVADADGRVAGFIAGSPDVRALYREFLVHDGPAAAIGAARRLLGGWRRALETLRHGAPGTTGTGRGTELLAVAVDPAWQGRGIGARLVDTFLTRVRADGGRAAYVVVAADNTPAVGLYRSAGFTEVGDFELHAGTTSLLMQWDDPAHASGGRG